MTAVMINFDLGSDQFPASGGAMGASTRGERAAVVKIITGFGDPHRGAGSPDDGGTEPISVAPQGTRLPKCRHCRPLPLAPGLTDPG